MTLVEATRKVSLYDGMSLRVIENPNPRQIANLLATTDMLRMIVDSLGHVFVWDATDIGSHSEVSDKLGIDWAVLGFITKNGVGLKPDDFNTDRHIIRQSSAIRHALGADVAVFVTDEA